MANTISRRDYTAIGYTGVVHITTDGSDPTTDGNIVLQPGDLWLDVQGSAFVLKSRTETATWSDNLLHWDAIQGKPSAFNPTVHPVDPDEGYHSGKIQAKNVTGIDFTHPTIQRVLAAAVVLQNS